MTDNELILGGALLKLLEAVEGLATIALLDNDQGHRRIAALTYEVRQMMNVLYEPPGDQGSSDGEG